MKWLPRFFEKRNNTPAFDKYFDRFTDAQNVAGVSVTVDTAESISAVYAAVAGDEEMEMLVMVWADGLRGDAAAKELEWDKNKYEATRKRLTRRLNALDSDRRPK